jgi:hypothetical protein
MSKLRLFQVLCVIGMIAGFYLSAKNIDTVAGGIIFLVSLLLLVISKVMRFIWKD